MKKDLGITLILLIVTNLIYASENEVFAKKSSPVFLNPKDRQSIGLIEIATPMKIIKKREDSLLVQVSGWSADGSPTVMFKQMGKRIIYAIINDDSVKHIKFMKSKMDDYDTKWNETSITVWTNKENVSIDLKQIWSAALELFQHRCSSCHSPPKFDQYSANQWPGIIHSMKDRAGLMPDEYQLIVKYLQNHSK